MFWIHSNIRKWSQSTKIRWKQHVCVCACMCVCVFVYIFFAKVFAGSKTYDSYCYCWSVFYTSVCVSSLLLLSVLGQHCWWHFVAWKMSMSNKRTPRTDMNTHLLMSAMFARWNIYYPVRKAKKITELCNTEFTRINDFYITKY